MLRSRIVMLLWAGLAVGVLGVVAAAPPKSTGTKKKSDEDLAASRDAADSKAGKNDSPPENNDGDESQKKVVKSNAEWRKILTSAQYKVARLKGTELPFGPAYKKFKKEGDGTYQCVCCGQTLFESNTKFESGTGWPSFYQPVDEKAIHRLEDTSDGTLRIEVECSRCDGHLGHVFDDGPRPTGERFCMNYASLKFVPKGKADKDGKATEKEAKPKAKGAKTTKSD